MWILVMESLGGTSSAPEVEVNYMTPEYDRAGKQITVRAGQLGLILLKSGLLYA